MAEFIIPPDVQTPFAQMLRAVSGVAADEDLHVTTPTFDRPANWDPAMQSPADGSQWALLRRLTGADLHAWGCRAWAGFSTEPPRDQASCHHLNAAYFPLEDGDERPETHTLWLFPASWYADIPAGFPIVDINGVLEEFEPGKTDDDWRYGLLAYGVMAPSEK